LSLALSAVLVLPSAEGAAAVPEGTWKEDAQDMAALSAVAGKAGDAIVEEDSGAAAADALVQEAKAAAKMADSIATNKQGDPAFSGAGQPDPNPHPDPMIPAGQPNPPFAGDNTGNNGGSVLVAKAPGNLRKWVEHPTQALAATDVQVRQFQKLYNHAKKLDRNWSKMKSKSHVGRKMAIPPRMAHVAIHRYQQWAKKHNAIMRRERSWKKRHPGLIRERKEKKIARRPPGRIDHAYSNKHCKVSFWGPWSRCKHRCHQHAVRIRVRRISGRFERCTMRKIQREPCYASRACKRFKGKFAGVAWKTKNFITTLKREHLPVDPATMRRFMIKTNGRRRRTMAWHCKHPACKHTQEGPAFFNNALALKAFINMIYDKYVQKYGKHTTEMGVVGRFIMQLSKGSRDELHPQGLYDKVMNRLRSQYRMGIPKYILDHIERAMSLGTGVIRSKRPSYGGTHVFSMIDHSKLGLHMRPKYIQNLRVHVKKLHREMHRLRRIISRDSSIKKTSMDMPQGKLYKKCDCNGARVKSGKDWKVACAKKVDGRCVKWHHKVVTGTVGQWCKKWNKRDRKPWCVVDKRCDHAFPTRDHRYKWNYCKTRDPTVSPWSKWTKCTRLCGGGIQYRNRRIVKAIHSKGTVRPNLKEKRTCARHKCAPLPPAFHYCSKWRRGKHVAKKELVLIEHHRTTPRGRMHKHVRELCIKWTTHDPIKRNKTTTKHCAKWGKASKAELIQMKHHRAKGRGRKCLKWVVKHHKHTAKRPRCVHWAKARKAAGETTLIQHHRSVVHGRRCVHWAPRPRCIKWRRATELLQDKHHRAKGGRKCVKYANHKHLKVLEMLLQNSKQHTQELPEPEAKDASSGIEDKLFFQLTSLKNLQHQTP